MWPFKKKNKKHQQDLADRTRVGTSSHNVNGTSLTDPLNPLSPLNPINQTGGVYNQDEQNDWKDAPEKIEHPSDDYAVGGPVEDEPISADDPTPSQPDPSYTTDTTSGSDSGSSVMDTGSTSDSGSTSSYDSGSSSSSDSGSSSSGGSDSGF